MNQSTDTLFSYNTFFISNEESHFPLIPEIIKFAKNLKSQINDDLNLFSTLSIVYGKRIVLNAKNSVFDKLNIDDFVEVVDFDPVKNNLILMGKKHPSDHTPIQWFIHHAKKEILITLLINDDDIGKLNIKIDSILVIKTQNNLLEMVKIIMKKLQYSSFVYIKNIGLLLTGKTFDEIEKNIKILQKE